MSRDRLFDILNIDGKVQNMYDREDMRERVAFFDSTVTELHTNLHDIEQLRSLGGHAFAAMRYAESAYLANIEGGHIVIPESRRNTSDLPVVVFRPGEKMQAHGDFASQTPTQRESNERQLSELLITGMPGWWISAISDEFAKKANLRKQVQGSSFNLSTTLPRGESDAYGTTNTFGFVTPLNSEYFGLMGESGCIIVRQRPIVAIMMKADTAPATLFHEIVHAKAAEKNPIYPVDPSMISDIRAFGELEARALTGAYEYNLHEAGHPAYSGANTSNMGDWLIHSMIRERAEDYAGRSDAMLVAAREVLSLIGYDFETTL